MTFIITILLIAGFAITISCASIGVDKAIRRNDPTYYPVVGVFLTLALLCGIGLGNML